MRIAGAFLAALLILAAAPNAAAEPEKERPIVTATWENDLFSGTDQHYTNGVRFNVLTPALAPGERPWLQRLFEDTMIDASHLSRVERVRFSFSVGQNMYTPTDPYATELLVNDRPYAGWLYGAGAVHAETRCFGGAEDCLDSVEVDLGIVGPQAYAKRTQDFVHDMANVSRFHGWHNQLKNEPGLVMMWERKWRAMEPRPIWGPIQFDAVPHFGASLGNVLTHANVGGALRLGYNLPDDFGPPSQIKAVANFADVAEDDLRAYLYVMPEVRFVARNIFLDGNTWADSHSVAKRPVVADLALGFAFEHPAGPKIALASVIKTKEFKGQKDNSRFGSITLSFRLPF